jgi:hypothetical protein
MSVSEVFMKYNLPTAGLAASDTLEQERREVLDSVCDALRLHPSDPDEAAACAYLVQHLASGARN